MLSPGDIAPTFRLPDADGTLHGPEPGLPSVVYFTSNRCPHARRWQARMNVLAADHVAAGVRVIAVNVPCAFPSPVAARMVSDGPAGVAAVRADPQWSHVAYVIDEGCEVAQAYGAQVTPDVYVLDGELAVRYRGAPDDRWDDEAGAAAWVRGAVHALLTGQAPVPQETLSVGCPIKWTASPLAAVPAG